MLDALLAHVLAMVVHQSVGGSTKNARRFKLLQHNLIVFKVDFQLITFRNIQCPAQLNRKYDSAQLVYSADDSCRLHSIFTPFAFNALVFLLHYHYNVSTCRCQIVFIRMTNFVKFV